MTIKIEGKTWMGAQVAHEKCELRGERAEIKVNNFA